MEDLDWPPIVSEENGMEFQYLEDSWIKLILDAFRLKPEDFPPWFLERR